MDGIADRAIMYPSRPFLCVNNYILYVPMLVLVKDNIHI
jgi:hypothetical protein